jgi:hypothetical protein
MQSWLDCPDISSEFLINSFGTLRHNFVRILNTTAEDAWNPSSEATTTVSPTIHTFSIARHLAIVLIRLRKNDMLRFSSQPLILFVWKAVGRPFVCIEHDVCHIIII